MDKKNDWRRIQITTLILQKIDTFKRRGESQLERGQTIRGNNLLQIAAQWERLLNQFKAAEIQWPESGGEGS